MKRVSVTEILAWRHCHQLWDYRFRQRLQAASVAPQLASGTAVHSTIQAVLGGAVAKDGMAAWAEGKLREQLLQRADTEADAKKYLPGVLRALSKVPAWVWTEPWHVEEKVEVEYGDVQIVGVPDLFLLKDNLLTIVEFKTTETEPLEFLLWNPQHRYYAALLAGAGAYKTQDSVVAFRYVCLPTSADRAVDHMPYVLTEAALAQAEREMLLGAREVGEGEVVPNYSRACSFCEYRDIDAVRIQGGDYREVIQESFTTRPHSN